MKGGGGGDGRKGGGGGGEHRGGEGSAWRRGGAGESGETVRKEGRDEKGEGVK